MRRNQKGWDCTSALDAADDILLVRMTQKIGAIPWHWMLQRLNRRKVDDIVRDDTLVMKEEKDAADYSQL